MSEPTVEIKQLLQWAEEDPEFLTSLRHYLESRTSTPTRRISGNSALESALLNKKVPLAACQDYFNALVEMQSEQSLGIPAFQDMLPQEKRGATL